MIKTNLKKLLKEVINYVKFFTLFILSPIFIIIWLLFDVEIIGDICWWMIGGYNGT